MEVSQQDNVALGPDIFGELHNKEMQAAASKRHLDDNAPDGGTPKVRRVEEPSSADLEISQKTAAKKSVSDTTLTQKVASFFWKPKVVTVTPNTSGILLGNTKEELRVYIKEKLSEMKGNYSSIYAWNEKSATPWNLLRDILCIEIAKPDLRVFGLELEQTELIYKDQFARILQKIRQAKVQSASTPCIIYIEQIDLLFRSIEGTAQAMVEHSFQSLRNHNILLVATSTKKITDLSLGIQRLFVNPPLKLRSPNEEEISKLFQNVFQKNSAYLKQLEEVKKSGTIQIYPDCLGVNFSALLSSIFKLCENRTPVFILRVYDLLDKVAFEGLEFAQWIQSLYDALDSWMDTEMEAAILYYDN